MNTTSVFIETLKVNNLDITPGVNLAPNTVLSLNGASRLTSIAPGIVGDVLSITAPNTYSFTTPGAPLTPDPFLKNEIKTNILAPNASTNISLTGRIINNFNNTNTVFGYTSSTGGNRNTFFGYESGQNNTGSFNTGIGARTLRANTTGSSNVALGFSALFGNTTGSRIIGIGDQAAAFSATSDIIAIGYMAFTGAVVLLSICIGNNSQQNAVNANNCIFIGHNQNACQLNDNIIIGHNISDLIGVNNKVFGNNHIITNLTQSIVMSDAANLPNVNSSVIIGFSAGSSQNSGVITAIGFESSKLSTNTVGNTSIGYRSLRNNTIGGGHTCLGFDAGLQITTGNNSAIFGSSAFNNSNSSNVSIFGFESGQSSGANCSFFGYRSGKSSTGTGNTFIGYQTGSAASGSNNVYLGSDAGSNSNMNNSISIGASTAQNSSQSGIFIGFGTAINNTGSRNLILANNSAPSLTGSDNVILGHDAAPILTSGARNIILGQNALNGPITQPSDSIFIGYNTGSTNDASQITVVGSNSGYNGNNNSVLLGPGIGQSAAGSSQNVIVGQNSATTCINMINSVILGYNTLSISTGTNNSVIIGSNTCSSSSNPPINNVIIGASAMTNGPSPGAINVCIGALAMGSSLTGNNNNKIAIGYRALQSSTGSNTISIGHNSGLLAQTDNVILGHSSGQNAVNNNVIIGQGLNTTGSSNTIIGNIIDSISGSFNSVLGYNIRDFTNVNNTVLGSSIFNQPCSGARNTIIGFNICSNAGNIVSGNDTIILGSFVNNISSISTNNNILIGNSLLSSGTSANLTLGTGNNLFMCLNAGRSTVINTTASNTICIGSQSGFSGGGPFTNSVSLGSNALVGASNSCQILDPADVAAGTFKFKSQIIGDAAWIGGGLSTASINNAGDIIRTPSDRRLKKNIEDLKISDEDFLKLQPVQYNFKNESKYGAQKEYGLIAQDVEKIFPDLVYNTGIESDEEPIKGLRYNSLIALLIKSNQDLIKKVDFLTKKVELLELNKK